VAPSLQHVQLKYCRLQLKCDGTQWRTEGKWRENWRMDWIASTLHTTSEHGVSSITTADAHISAASSRLNWHRRRFKWTRPFRRKTKSGFCACAITFQLASTYSSLCLNIKLHSRLFSGSETILILRTHIRLGIEGLYDLKKAVYLFSKRNLFIYIYIWLCILRLLGEIEYS